MKLAIYIFAVFSLFALSCTGNPDKYCTEVNHPAIRQTLTPRAIDFPEVVLAEATYYCYNTCCQSADFEERVEGFHRYRALRVTYIGCACGDAFINKKAVYSFQPEAPGTYYLHFLAGEGITRIDTVEVR